MASARDSTESLWNSRYRDVGSSKVSWFQDVLEPSLDLITKLNPAPDAAIVDIGGGTSRLAQHLLGSGHTDVTVVDMSSVALDEQAEQLRSAGTPPAHLIQADLRTWEPPRTFNLWHDRAVYHFLTDPADQSRYWDVVRAHVVRGGYVVIGTFADDGPTTCSTLPVQRYSLPELISRMGDGFEVVTTLRHVHTTPAGGKQSFSWVVAKRI